MACFILDIIFVLIVLVLNFESNYSTECFYSKLSIIITPLGYSNFKNDETSHTVGIVACYCWVPEMACWSVMAGGSSMSV